MNLKQATEILASHQKWRKGGENEPTDPTQLGIAIDVILKHLKTLKAK
jgi:hypothetical protein